LTFTGRWSAISAGSNQIPHRSIEKRKPKLTKRSRSYDIFHWEATSSRQLEGQARGEFTVFHVGDELRKNFRSAGDWIEILQKNPDYGCGAEPWDELHATEQQNVVDGAQQSVILAVRDTDRHHHRAVSRPDRE
jgi:hypothetical protein